MDILIILILTSLGVAAGFLGGFFWAVKSGQYEDTRTPALRVLFDETASAPALASAKPAAQPGSDAADRALGVGGKTRAIPATSNPLSRSDLLGERVTPSTPGAGAPQAVVTEEPVAGRASSMLDLSKSNQS